MLCSGLDWRAGECVSPGLRSNTQFVKRAVLWTAFLYPVPRGEISKVVCETRHGPYMFVLMAIRRSFPSLTLT